jgi:hypothetical protein
VGKKHYIGITRDVDKKESVIKGMEGVKSDRPEFIRRTFLQLVNDIKDNIDPLSNTRKALDELNNRNMSADLLAISLARAAKDCLI